MEDTAKIKTNTRYRIAILAAIKKYYDYLIAIGKRHDHPCRTIHIKHNRDRKVIHHDLFTSAELELLLEREERYPALKLKNQSLISLLIFQGLSTGEIIKMKVHHIDLDSGKIFVKERKNTMRRHLDMHPKQYRILDRYINESRKELLKGRVSDALFIGKLGVAASTCEVGYLVEQFDSLFPGRNLNPTTVRQSVIANWLNEKKFSLETVQLMAGHRFISTTLRYRRNNQDEKRLLINRFHPLG
ncbi:MAG: tyrosine-type recombinase/integrase [Bacteroidia bacterium]|nr:tyrosine-type recombinase/integrase [Bacteroidia bacterium]